MRGAWHFYTMKNRTLPKLIGLVGMLAIVGCATETDDEDEAPPPPVEVNTETSAKPTGLASIPLGSAGSR